jgi:hypothetical protein
MNWPELILGSVVGGIVGFVLTEVLKMIAESPGKNARRYAGMYYGYYYSTSGNGDIVTERWWVARRLLGGMGVRIEMTYRNQTLSYKGRLVIRERHIYAHLLGVGHSEEMFFIFPEPVTAMVTNCVGTFTALTMDKRPYAGKHLLAREELTPRKAKALLGDEVRIIGTEAQEIASPTSGMQSRLASSPT